MESLHAMTWVSFQYRVHSAQCHRSFTALVALWAKTFSKISGVVPSL